MEKYPETGRKGPPRASHPGFMPRKYIGRMEFQRPEDLDVDTATQVGLRKSPTPVILKVDARAAHAGGVAFYGGNEKAWLADNVPATFLQKPAK